MPCTWPAGGFPDDIELEVMPSCAWRKLSLPADELDSFLSIVVDGVEVQVRIGVRGRKVGIYEFEARLIIPLFGCHASLS